MPFPFAAMQRCADGSPAAPLFAAVSAALSLNSTHSVTQNFKLPMAQEHAKEEPKGLFTSIIDGVKNAGNAVVDGVGKVLRSFVSAIAL